MGEGAHDRARARLLLLADSAFPTGAFAHSWGLEWAVRAGWVTDAGSLAAWTRDALRFGIAPLDGRAVARAAAVTAPGTESAPFRARSRFRARSGQSGSWPASATRSPASSRPAKRARPEASLADRCSALPRTRCPRCGIIPPTRA